MPVAVEIGEGGARRGDELEGLIKEGVRREDGHSDDPRYWHQVEVLCEIRRIEPRASVYTYIMGEQPGEIIFVTSWSACVSDNPYGAEFKGSWITENPAPNEAGFRAITLQEEAPNFCTYGDPGCEPVSYTDDYGTWVSAFAPIRNSKGQAVAALGVDFEASYVKQVQQGILESIYVAFGLTYAVLFLLVYLVSNFFSRPMTVLTKAADKIGEAQYEEGLGTLKQVKTSERFPDEIFTLQNVFESMVGKVYQREENLRRTVEELRIEIDEVKRSKAVGEIVDTEFFQELSTKADLMRSQRRARFSKKDPEA